MSSGISIAVCTHNGAGRLPATLQHLAAQKTVPGLEWEVLLVDNASTDETAAVSLRLWPHDAPAPLRIVREPKLGLSHARERAFAEARHELVVFVDDDNWLAPDWLAIADEIMRREPALAVLGSHVEPVFETDPPPWLAEALPFYSITRESDIVSNPLMFLPPGAGMCVRKSAWNDLTVNGFRFALTDRQGGRLFSGGDTEMNYALLLAGWRCGADRRLKVKHFLPAERLTWEYLRRLSRDHAASAVALDAYACVDQAEATLRDRLRQHWLWQVAATLRRLARMPGKAVLSLWLPMEGDFQVLEIEYRVGRAIGLWRLGRRYGQFRREIREARWRKLDRLPA
jgi:glycosyltransferase involved in cell wall biosynthesis